MGNGNSEMLAIYGGNKINHSEVVGRCWGEVRKLRSSS
jgi:hypothetical protein